jgi:ribonuclease Z
VTYDDGTERFCALLREANRWQTESFSFQTTEVVNDENGNSWNPPPWAPQNKRDAFDLVCIKELDWRTPGAPLAYNYNDVTITHFPAVHCRQGSISYKLVWKTKDARGFPVSLSMIFTGDTKPTDYVIDAAKDGVDVLIHEVASPPETWVEKFTGLTPADGAAYQSALAEFQRVQDSSHTEQKALGYILNQLTLAGRTPPRLAVGTHFAAESDTIKSALADIRFWYPKGQVLIATDLVVINVTKAGIRTRRAEVSDYTWVPANMALSTRTYALPKYNDGTEGDPYKQLDPASESHWITSDEYDPA